MAFQDFDLISQRRQEEKKKKFKQRLILAFVASVIVILLLAAGVCFAIYKTNRRTSATHDHPPPPPPQAKPKTIQSVVKSVCVNTDYKKTCEETILKEVKNNASATPIDILRASLVATSKEIDDVVKQVKGVTFDTPMKKAALNDCLVLLKDAKDELNSSISSIKGADHLSTAKADLNNWLSAVISYQQTCIDGFPEGADKEKIKKLVDSVRMLGSNTLSVVSQVSDVLAEVSHGSHRRLMSFDQIGWINNLQPHRRILKADGAKFTPNVTVAKDNSGNFTTINEALKAMPKKFKGRYVIYVKEGVYDETVVVAKEMENVTMYGDGSQKSIITGSKNFVDGVTTFETASFGSPSTLIVSAIVLVVGL